MSKLLYQNFEVGGGIHNGLPVGSIIPFASDLIIPNGFLICAGQPVSRTMYPDLFQVLGTKYGSGDGETTFNLPNLINGEFLEGSSVAGTSKTPGLPNITGSIDVVQVNQASGAFTRNTSGYTWSASASNSYTKRAEFNASLSNSIYGNSQTVQPKSLTVIYIIKAFDSLELDSGVLDLTQLSNDLSLRLQRHQVPAFNKLIKITTSQTWSAPYNGWYKFTIKGAGGGGAGGNSSSTGGAGGGEGGTSFVYTSLDQNDPVAITIGAGGLGAGGNSAKVGGTGGTTSVIINGQTYYATGGTGGAYSYGSPAGKGGIGDIVGAPGCLGAIYTSVAPGGSGGGQGGGISLSSPSTNYIGPGDNGVNGGGGAGGGGYSTARFCNGGNGGNGFVWIEYFDPTL